MAFAVEALIAFFLWALFDMAAWEAALIFIAAACFTGAVAQWKFGNAMLEIAHKTRSRREGDS